MRNEYEVTVRRETMRGEWQRGLSFYTRFSENAHTFPNPPPWPPHQTDIQTIVVPTSI